MQKHMSVSACAGLDRDTDLLPGWPHSQRHEAAQASRVKGKKGKREAPRVSTSACPAVRLSAVACEWLAQQAGRKLCLAVNDCWLQAGHPPWPPARKGRTLPSTSGRNWNL